MNEDRRLKASPFAPMPVAPVMRFLPTLALVWEASASQSSVNLRGLAGGDRVVGAVQSDMDKLIANLDEVVDTLGKDQKASIKIWQSRSEICETESKRRDAAVEEGQGRIRDAQADQLAAVSEVEDAQQLLKSALEQVAKVGKEMSDLTAKLKGMREEHNSQKTKSVSLLRQLDMVIGKAYRRQRRGRGAGAAAAGSPTVDAEVNYLQELGTRLSSWAPAHAEQAPPSFVQSKAKRAWHGDGDQDAVAALRQDRSEVFQADEKETKGFDEKEQEMIGLIEKKRQEMQKFQNMVQQAQTKLAETVKKSAETNRTLAMLDSSYNTEKTQLAIQTKFCALLSTFGTKLMTQRRVPYDNIRMAVKMLQSLDAAAFIAQDAQNLRSAPSFVQVRAVQRDAVSQASQMDEAVDYGQEEAAGDLAAVSGPFGKVTGMIKELIASLRAEANKDTTQNQFCEDGKASALNEIAAAKAEIVAAESDLQWANQSTLQQKKIMEIYEEKAKVNTKANGKIDKDFVFERDRLETMHKHNKDAKEVITRTLQILGDDCDVRGDSAALMQSGTDKGERRQFNVGSRSQCKKAIELLGGASDGLVELDETLKKYWSYFERFKEEAKAELAKDDVATDMVRAKSAYLKRVSEVEDKQGELKGKKANLKLLEESFSALEQKCSPAVETAEDRMQRRAMEVEALRNALHVLEGEAVPL